MSDSDQDDSSKTEDPTPKRLSEARDQGNVASSREINNFISLFASTLIVGMAGSYICVHLKDTLVFFLESAHTVSYERGIIGLTAFGAIIEAGKVVIWPLLFMALAGIIGSLAQFGFLFTSSPMEFNLNKISPMKGLTRLFGMRGIIETFKGLIKLVVVGSVAYFFLKPIINKGEAYVGMDVSYILEEVRKDILEFMSYVLFIFFFVAILDYMYQKHEWLKKLRMSKQEIKDEYRQSEGDPKVKAKLKQMRIQKARRRMMQNIPKADVVITNPTHYAIALEYKMETMPAPVCLAKGHDALALRIREIAKENKVPIVENPPLARALYASVELEEEIPEEHYQAVAKVISYVMSLKNRGRSPLQ